MRNSGTDRDFQHHRPDNFNIAILSSKGQAIAGAMVAKFILPLVPNLGTDRGFAPLMPVMYWNPISVLVIGKLSGPHGGPVVFMKD